LRPTPPALPCAAAVIDWPALLAISRLTELSDESDQRWTVSRLPDLFSGGTHGAEPLQTAPAAVGGNGDALPPAPFETGVVSFASVFSANFAVSLQLPGGFVAPWVPAAAVGVALVGVLAAVALFVFLLERRLRYNLLVSMLPARVVRRMGSLSGAACADPSAGAAAKAAGANLGAGAGTAAGAAATNAAGSFAERHEHVTVLFTGEGTVPLDERAPPF
jgi:hypothetical protein